jgi:solute carrier family 35 protein F1/2
MSTLAAQSFLNYFLLTIAYTTWLACRRSETNIVQIMKTRGWKYFLLAAVDVEANYLVVKAYHYTTVTSVQVGSWYRI